MEYNRDKTGKTLEVSQDLLHFSLSVGGSVDWSNKLQILYLPPSGSSPTPVQYFTEVNLPTPSSISASPETDAKSADVGNKKFPFASSAVQQYMSLKTGTLEDCPAGHKCHLDNLIFPVPCPPTRFQATTKKGICTACATQLQCFPYGLKADESASTVFGMA